MARRLKHAIEAFDLDQIERRSISLLELVETIAQQRGPDAAGRAEAAAFMREEMHEIARGREHVATAVEHHQGARRGRVLECDAAPKFMRRQRHSGGPAELDALGITGAAGVQNFRDRHAERKFINAGRGAIARHGQQLRAGRELRAYLSEPFAAARRDHCHERERFDIVDAGRLAEIAIRDRERRTYARRAALAFQRFDQRAFLAANISAGAEVNVDVEIETVNAEDAAAKQPARAGAPALVRDDRADSDIRRANRGSPCWRR